MTFCASGLLGGLNVGDVMLGLRLGAEVRRCERDIGETRLGAAVEPGFEDVDEVAAVDDGEGGIDDNEVIDAPDVDGDSGEVEREVERERSEEVDEVKVRCTSCRDGISASSRLRN